VRGRFQGIIDNRWLISALRLALGGLFIASSIGKLQYQAEFTDAVLSYDILPTDLAEFYASALPWAELFIGCSLILGIFSIFASALSIPLIISFLIANIYSFFHPVEDPCGCLGKLVVLSHPVALTIDLVMLLIAWLLLFHPDKAGFLGIRSLLVRPDLGLERRARFIFQAALVALAMVVVMPFLGGAPTPPDGELYDTPELLFLYEGDRAYFESEFAILRDLEREYSGRIVFKAFNYGKDPQLAKEFNVEISPTVLLIIGKTKEGGYLEYRQRFEGSVDKQSLKDAFDEMLGSG
jgi:uncharacterized membrane protein YphA (DoxX/SURF4 family)